MNNHAKLDAKDPSATPPQWQYATSEAHKDDPNCGCFPGHVKTTFEYGVENQVMKDLGYQTGGPDSIKPKTHANPRKQCRNKPPPTGSSKAVKLKCCPNSCPCPPVACGMP